MADQHPEFLASTTTELNNRDLALVVMAGGIAVAFWASLAAWLGSYVLTVIAIVGIGVALGAAVRLALDSS